MPPLEGFEWIYRDEEEQQPLNPLDWLRRTLLESLESSKVFIAKSIFLRQHSETIDERVSDGYYYHLAGGAILTTICIFLLLIRHWRHRRSRKNRHYTSSANRSRTLSGSSSRQASRERFDSFGSFMDVPLFDPARRNGKRSRRRSSRSRSRSQSSSSDLAPSDGEYNDDLFELLAVEGSSSSSHENPMNRIRYYGPTQFSLVYESLVPPPSWLEVSRQVIPPDKHFRLQRYLALTLSEASTLGIHHATMGHSPEAAQAIAQRSLHSMPYTVITKKNQEKYPPVELPLEQVSMHIVSPVLSGVVQLYVKDAPRDEWMEHTLPSAALAAQFQTDMLAMQLLGPAIYNMFQALQLIHQGSIAHRGREFVWHDQQAIGNDPTACDDDLLAQCCYGIAWDDCLRCFGSTLPSLRLRLEALWWKNATEHMSKDTISQGERTNSSAPTSSSSKDSATNGLAPEYVKKRLLIGLMDFFRLFVPHVPDTAVPRNHISRARVEQMLRWRARVARASVLVSAYCDARRVVNKGWTLHRPVPDSYWRRRLAFDDIMDNIRWDSAADKKHVYYEGTVSRDVICQVRGSGSNESRNKMSLSLTQGYSLVGIHTIDMASSDKDPLLRPDQDPVMVIPALRSLIEAHPDLDFFIAVTHIEAQRLWHIAVFVRSLPKGVDPSFDATVESFTKGGPDQRDEKLEVIIHLGTPHDRLKWRTWYGVSFLSTLSRLTATKGSAPIPKQIAGDRTPISALRISSCGKVLHFGGSLQAVGLPRNYVAHIATLSSKKATTFRMRILLLFMETLGLEQEVLDVSYVLAGGNENELPERVLGTYRMVQPKLSMVLPANFILPKRRNDATNKAGHESAGESSGISAVLKLFVTDPILAGVDPLTRLLGSPTSEPSSSQLVSDSKTGSPAQGASLLATSDPLEEAVNEMIETLEQVYVPVRRNQLLKVGFDSDDAIAGPDGLVNVPVVQMITRDDIRRFFVASRCSHSKAAMRIVETIAWRGRTFPIDSRLCRIELQNGQFFQQGCDKEGHLVFYFRSMLLGPWRRDENAAIAAVLFRFEQALRNQELIDDNSRCSLVICLGKPHKSQRKRQKDKVDENATACDDGGQSGISSMGADSNSDSNSDTDGADANNVSRSGFSNPRMEPDEVWSLHSSKRLARTLVTILLDHYPERLYRAYVVVAHGNTAYARTAMGGLMRLSKYVRSANTRDKVRFLVRYSDLREFIDKDELITFCGGNAPILPAAFECH